MGFNEIAWDPPMRYLVAGVGISDEIGRDLMRSDEI